MEQTQTSPGAKEQSKTPPGATEQSKAPSGAKRHAQAPAGFVQTMERCAANLAHQVGHMLQMEHDTESCACRTRTCVMQPNLSTTSTFSQCSIDSYTDLIEQHKADCLLNIPLPGSIHAPQTCGNKIVEGDEPCDCGSEKECKNDPCCDFNCEMTQGTECVSGTCCKNCKFAEKGQPCRIPVSECDLAEYCTGSSDACPPDVYMQNGTPCNNDLSVCYKKTCYDADRHCQLLFGSGSKSASLHCFAELNNIGDRFGNCGFDPHLGQVKSCEIQ
ncbi:disintegrin and metalloproteinase domain-containing protein 9-like [Rhinatrema bivittatum]|uniref:disintegrin and metalloproteinase domain-containing protein 9-like n=1 Tax=Rhinatrema bivittatum TaxID=194408 RepID=UPI00112CD654|nr:disintegrin and metalloproteinase domain-containing protein 9-like [Rhinatrema bivittatum]